MLIINNRGKAQGKQEKDKKNPRAPPMAEEESKSFKSVEQIAE